MLQSEREKETPQWLWQLEISRELLARNTIIMISNDDNNNDYLVMTSRQHRKCTLYTVQSTSLISFEHLSVEETEVKRGEVTCPESHS